MHKWHIKIATGRGKPRACVTLFRHPIHTSTLRRQDGGQDKFLEEAAKPLSNRGKRLKNATEAVQNLYIRHATKDNSKDGHTNTASNSVPLKGGQGNKPAVIDARTMGVPLSKNELEGRAGSVRKTYDYRPLTRRSARRIGDEAIETRGSDPRPEGARDYGRLTMGRRGALDARSLAAKPVETVGGAGRQSSPTRAPRSENAENGEQHFRNFRLDSGIVEHAPRRHHARGGEQPFQTRRQNGNGMQEGAPGTSNAFQNRTPTTYTQPTPGKSGAGGRPRRPRKDGNGEPGRMRGYGGAQASHKSGILPEMWNEEEAEYFKSKLAGEEPRAPSYNPSISKAKLKDMGPDIISGRPASLRFAWRERMALADQYLKREFIQWDSKEQKADVMVLAEWVKANRKPKGEEERKSEAEAETQKETEALMKKLFGGLYELVRPQQDKDILGHVARHADKNESYFTEDEKSLLEKVRSILPADAGRIPGNIGKAAKK